MVGVIEAEGPRQNRVTPTGEIIRHAARGLFMGNRGCLHDANGALGRSRWKSTLWIICQLEFKGRRRPLMSPGQYTELFFLDEAVALAAGHRPCGECRRDEYRKFIAGWAAGNGTPEPDRKTMDAALHAARVDPRTKTQIAHRAPCASLPDGTFIRHGDRQFPHLVLGDRLIPFEDYTYGGAVGRPDGPVDVLTPAPTIGVLCGGYFPVLHETALSLAAVPHLGQGRRHAP
jgi:hypothetical protein